MAFFFPVRFKTFVQLAPKELSDDFEECILRKLRKSYEGVCSRYGYIKPGSLRLLQRSAGMLMKPHFNGYIRFETVLVGEVCNPTKGTVVSAVVKAKNNLGLLAESAVDVGGEPLPILDIIVPKRSAGIASEVDLDTVQVRDTVFVEVMGKRYQLNDRKISIIGRVVVSMKEPTDDDGEPDADVAAEDTGDMDVAEDDVDDDEAYSDEEGDGTPAPKPAAQPFGDLRAIKKAIETVGDEVKTDKAADELDEDEEDYEETEGTEESEADDVDDDKW